MWNYYAWVSYGSYWTFKQSCLQRFLAFHHKHVSLFTDVFVSLTECSGSVKLINLSFGQAALSGSIYSPSYPDFYSSNEDCKWRIIAPYGQKVLIHFTSLDLEDDAGCDYDSVQIFNGSSDSYGNKLLIKTCGSSLPPPVYSSDRYIYMRFQSDGSGQGRGFVAHYKALSDSSGR